MHKPTHHLGRPIDTFLTSSVHGKKGYVRRNHCQMTLAANMPPVTLGSFTVHLFEYYTLLRRPGPGLDRHIHDPLYELIVIREGTGTYYAERTPIRYVPGTVILLAPGIPHRWGESRSMTRMQVMYLGMQQSESAVDRADYRKIDAAFPFTCHTRAMSKEAGNILENLDSEAMRIDADSGEAAGDFSIAYCESLFKNFLYLILRARVPAAVVRGRRGTSVRTKAPHRDGELISAIEGLIERRFGDAISMDAIERELSLPKKKIQRLFRHFHGMTCVSYINNRRMQRARVLLAGGLPIATIASRLGFDNVNYFFRMFKRTFAMTPEEYRARMKDIDG
ncbi:MAG: helix-turn-helix domain-containing protein [Spirochaetota bacterium]